MKKATILLAVMLAFSGCTPAAPSDVIQTDAVSEVLTVSDPVEPSISEPISQISSQASSVNPQQDAPVPDAPPMEEIGAIPLPQSVASSDHGYGLEVLTPAQYNRYYPQDRGDPSGYKACDYFEPAQGERYAIANQNGKIVTDFSFTLDEKSDWLAPTGIVPVQIDGKYGAVSAGEGKQLLPYEFDIVSCVPNSSLMRASKGDTVEIYNLDGTLRYTMERGDDFHVLGGERDILLKDGMLRIYNHKDSSPVQNFACDEIKLVSSSTGMKSNGKDLIAFHDGENWGLCDRDGNILADPVYEELEQFDGDYAGMTLRGKKGVLDYTGKLRIKAEWDDLIVYSNSVSVCRDGRWGAFTDIDAKKLTIEPTYDFVGPFGDYGYACFERNGKYGLLDRDGNEMASAKYDGRIYTVGANLDKGYYMVGGQNGPGSAGVIGNNGKVILPSDNLIYPGTDGEAYNMVLTPSDKWGYIDRTGKFVIDAKYDEASEFLKGKDFAFVKQDGKILLIDRKGNTLLKTEFSSLNGYNPETLVCMMEYTNEKGETKSCLVRITLPA